MYLNCGYYFPTNRSDDSSSDMTRDFPHNCPLSSNRRVQGSTRLQFSAWTYRGQHCHFTVNWGGLSPTHVQPWCLHSSSAISTSATATDDRFYITFTKKSHWWNCMRNNEWTLWQWLLSGGASGATFCSWSHVTNLFHKSGFCMSCTVNLIYVQ